VWRSALEGLWRATPPTDLAVIRAPTLVLWGERDELLERPQQDDLVRAIPGARLVVYGDTGHLVLWEQPERVATDVRSFLARCRP
jgi:pimeloyl-ACP methyl ester carboxylesterase